MTSDINFNLSAVTTFHIDAKASTYIEYTSVEELKEILCRYNGKRILHKGAGSNLLFTRDFDGVVLHSAMRGISIVDDTDDDRVLVKALSGTVWDDFVKWSVDKELYGAENLSAIPGEVGASAIQNIGAYGVEVKDIIHSVSVIDTKTMESAELTVDTLEYDYRHSKFKTDDWVGKYIVTSVTYKLSRKPKYTLTYGPLKQLAESGTTLTLTKIRDHIIDIRASKLPDPDIFGNAGSFFKNPLIPASQFMALKESYPQIPHYEVDDKTVKVPAAWLIEHTGLKGRSVGGAMVYPLQCLVIINHNNASASDVVNLSNLIIDTVMQKFGITLSPEVIFI